MNSPKTNFFSESIIHYSPLFSLIICCTIGLIFSSCSESGTDNDNPGTRPRVTRVKIKQQAIGPVKRGIYPIEMEFDQGVRFQDPNNYVNVKITIPQSDSTIVDTTLNCQSIHTPDQKTLCGCIMLDQDLDLKPESYMAIITAPDIDSASVSVNVVSITLCDSLCSSDTLTIR